LQYRPSVPLALTSFLGLIPGGTTSIAVLLPAEAIRNCSPDCPTDRRQINAGWQSSQ
jgi:hypothetical protein